MSSVPTPGMPVITDEQALAAEVAAQVKAEFDARRQMSASEMRDIAAAQALLDARASPSIILEGEMGSGKTHALSTLLVDANGKFEGPPVSGIEKVVLLTHEAGFEDVLGHIPKSRLSWHYLPISEGSFEGLQKMVQIINTQTNQTIANMGGINRHMYPEFDKLLGLCNNFIDQNNDNKELGPVWKFPQNWCLWYESVSALSEIAMNNAVGDKPFLEQLDYQKIQKPIKRFLNHLVHSTKCLFVATAHLERETNFTTGASELMVSTVGRALPPILPRFFSDVIVCERIDEIGTNQQYTSKFIWSTVKPGVRTKTRNLPWGSGFKPDFVPLLNNFRRRKAASTATEAKIVEAAK